MKYTIKVIEKHQKIVSTDADSAQEAIQFVYDAYKSGRIILDDFLGESLSIIKVEKSGK